MAAALPPNVNVVMACLHATKGVQRASGRGMAAALPPTDAIPGLHATEGGQLARGQGINSQRQRDAKAGVSTFERSPRLATACAGNKRKLGPGHPEGPGSAPVFPRLVAGEEETGQGTSRLYPSAFVDCVALATPTGPVQRSCQGKFNRHPPTGGAAMEQSRRGRLSAPTGPNTMAKPSCHQTNRAQACVKDKPKQCCAGAGKK